MTPLDSFGTTPMITLLSLYRSNFVPFFANFAKSSTFKINFKRRAFSKKNYDQRSTSKI